MRKYLTEEKRPFMVHFEEVQMEGDKLPKGAIMRVRGRAHRAGRVTSNGTLYRPTLYKSEAARLAPHMEDGKVFMYPRHPGRREDGSLEPMSPAESTGLMRVLEVTDNEDGTSDVYITADLADTDSGRNIAALVRMGGMIPISSRGTGSAEKVRMSDQHPLAKVNAEWIGKDVREIGEDFRLNTFDFVSEASSGGSETVGFQEEKETDMNFDIEKLTEDQWKVVTESDKMKAVIEAAVKAAVKAREEELNKEFDEKLVKMVAERVDEHLKSDEFAEAVKKANGKTRDEVTEEACPECGAKMAKGAKFCSACGAKMEAEKPTDDDEKNKRIEELTKKIEEMGDTIGKLTARNKQNDEQRAFEQKMEEKLAGKPDAVQRNVRTALEEREVVLEEADKVIDGEIVRIENIFKDANIDPAKLPGKGTVKNEDDKNTDDDKKTLTEDKKAQVGRMPRG